MNVRVLTVADLHLRVSLYKQLEATVEKHQPDIVACVGDFLDADHPRPDGLLSPQEAASTLSSLPCKVVLVRGNHEDWPWPEFETAWNLTTTTLNALHGSAVVCGPLVIVGFPCLMGGDEFYGCGRELPDYSLSIWFKPILHRFSSAARTLWLIHEPPSKALASPFLFERIWRDAVEDYRPLLTVSGHDHRTPLETGRWHAKIGRTICLNLGQQVYPVPGYLHYSVLDFEFTGDQPSLPSKFTFQKFGDGL